jgi:PAS domain S-box-containing protein
VSHTSEVAVIFTPLGRDASVARAILVEANMAATIAPSLPALVAALRAGAGYAIVTEEALRDADLRDLSAFLAGQPEWSDFPFILLTERGGGLERNPGAGRMIEALGNVTFLERPFHPTTLVSLSRSALRVRRRQYQARTSLETIRQGEERLRAALRAGSLGAWALETPSMALHLSDQGKAHYGRGPGDDFGWRDLIACIHPDDRPKVRERMAAALEGGEDYDAEYRCLWPDGAEHWLHVRGALDRETRQGRLFSGVTHDITERKAAERQLASLAATLEDRVAAATSELKSSEARLRSIFATSYQYLAELTPLGTLIDANATSLASIGAALGDVVGKPFWTLPWFADTPGAPEVVRETVKRVAAGETVRQEITVKIPAGWRTFDFSLGPIREEGGRGEGGRIVALLAEALDITERRKAEERLLQSQKLETIGQLTGGVAHDFNNLLTPIVGSIDLLRRKLIGDERAQTMAAAGLQSAERAKLLINRLLAFARRQTLDPQPVDVAALIEGMRELIERSIGPTIAVEVAADTALPAAQVDPNQMELSILNLAVNARDAMPRGGRLEIATTLDRAGAAHPAGLRPGPYVKVSVADSGVGMDQATAKRAIEPFYTTKGVGQGTGLGLSMVHGLMAQLGGGMAIDSEVGRGTVVCLWLPALDVRAAAGPAPFDGAAVIKPTRRARILLVDDEALVRFATADMLRDAGYEVIEAASAAEARERVRAGLAPDVLVTDQLMPGGRGTDLASGLRETLPDLKVLVATGYADMPDIRYPRIAKPFAAAELVERVRALVEVA